MYSSGVKEACSPQGVVARAVDTRSRAGISRDWKPFSVIEHIEALCPKLEGSAFFDHKVLEQCHIEIDVVRIPQAVPVGVSEG